MSRGHNLARNIKDAFIVEAIERLDQTGVSFDNR